MKILLISDFSINNLSGYLKNDLLDQKLQTIIAPFNQVHQTLISDSNDCWIDKPDYAFVWTQPERILNAFQTFLNNEKFEMDKLIQEIQDFSNLLILASQRVSSLFVANWTVDLSLNYRGIVNTKSGIGVVEVLSKMNSTLEQSLSTIPNIFILNSQKWISNSGNIAYSPKLWYLSKTPFHTSVFSSASKDISSCIKSEKGGSRKLIITDLDNTLWGGVVGDVGYENLILGGHNPIGEAYKDFQLALKSISNLGVVLAITSKNEESVALKAIENHPEMVLRKDSFVSWRINWDDKAKNIFEISQELNLGLDSIVFLDDNPFERERVKHSLPEVFVPELPKDPMLYRQFLLQLDCFNSNAISEEDLKRTELYALEKQRNVHKNGFNDLEEWLKSIDIKVKCEKINDENFQRALQLLNKTNQMNLMTARYSEKELLDKSFEENSFSYTFSVKDNFGDAGLTGVIGLKKVQNVLFFTDFVLSCRVIGRKIEETMLSVAFRIAKENGCSKLIANYSRTDKNKPCHDFFKSSGFEETDEIFVWDLKTSYVRPYYIDLEMNDFI